MKRLVLVLFLFPALVLAQTSKSKVKPKPKVIPMAKPTVKTLPAVKKPADSFLVNGEFTNLNDGSVASLVDGNTGAVIQNGVVKKGKFVFTGKMPQPDFRIIFFDNNQQNRMILFLDNSLVTIKGDANDLAKAIVSGSPSNSDFIDFNNLTQPFQQFFGESATYDSAQYANAAKIVEEFVKQKPHSFVAPLALFRYYQLSDNIERTEQLLNTFPAPVKNSGIAVYTSQRLAEDKQNLQGYMAPDFTQPDTAGVAVSLSQFRGKYVLLDFWASWCGPCRHENPNVVAAYNKYKNKNFTILGVSLDRPGKKDDWLRAIKDDNLTWTNVSDLQFWQNAAAQQYQVQGIPQNFLINPEGKVIAKNLRGAALDRKLAKVLR